MITRFKDAEDELLFNSVGRYLNKNRSDQIKFLRKLNENEKIEYLNKVNAYKRTFKIVSIVCFLVFWFGFFNISKNPFVNIIAGIVCFGIGGSLIFGSSDDNDSTGIYGNKYYTRTNNGITITDKDGNPKVYYGRPEDHYRD